MARFYDPQISHFVQADTIVPGAGDPMAFNRYAYVNYSPLVYRDPSGNWGCRPGLDGGNCAGKDKVETIQNIIQEKFPNVTLFGNFSYEELYITKHALELTFNTHGGNIDSYTNAVGSFSIFNVDYPNGMAPPYANIIIFPDQSFAGSDALFNLVHEIGHRFDFNGSDGKPWKYKSQTFVDVFAPGCFVGDLGCLGSDPWPVYELFNFFSLGETRGFYETDTDHTSLYAVRNGSIEDFAETYANIVFVVNGLESRIPEKRYVRDSARRIIIEVWVDLIK